MSHRKDIIKVLIIEDNEGDLFIAQEYFKKTQFEKVLIDHAEDLNTGHLLLQTNKYDIILLDLSLGETFGTDTIRALNPQSLCTPVVILTGVINDEISLGSFKYGVQDYLLKGQYDWNLLERTVRYAIERKKNEAILHESQERYKALFDKNPVPMWAYDVSTGAIIMVNHAATRNYGYSREEFLMLRHNDIVDRSSKVLAQEHSRHLTKTREVIDVEIVRNPLMVDGREATLIVAYDITARKAAEEKMRLWESIVIHSTDAVLVTTIPSSIDNSTKVIYINEAFEKMSGFTSAEVVGKTPYPLFENVENETRRRLEDAIRLLKPIETEFINYRKDGSEYWTDLTMVPVSNNEGVCTHLVMVQRDTTEKKQLVEGTRKRLEQQVQERTRELHKALSKEKELVELKNRFVAIASHEFRTPLSTINFTAEFLELYYPTLSTEQVEEKLKKIKKQVNHMTVLLEDVIVAGRSDNKIPVIKKPLQLKGWISKLLDDITLSTKSTHAIQLQYNDQVEEVVTDEKLLRNILINLTTNAIKFSPQKQSIFLDVNKREDSLVILVKDEGIGISPSDKERLFEPFHRGGNTNGIQGTGLGLSIVKKAVDLLKGDIKIDSVVGEGTSITLEIPYN
jgi:PAS domain S-box-containing protein